MPLLYFSYGMTKTGSTLAYHFARAVLEENGKRQPQLGEDALGSARRRINYVDDVSAEMAQAMLDAGKQLGHPIVIKTHQRPSPAVRALFENGDALGHACWRDPRDMALSMLDHGRKARAKGHEPFAEIATLEDALRSILGQIETLQNWIRLPGVIPLAFDDLAFQSDHALKAIARQLGLSATDSLAAAVKTSHFTQFNKGVPNRHRTEMTQQEAAHFAQTCPAWMTNGLGPGAADR